MTYPWVAASLDYGPRKGPVKAFVVHMAEGGGTVGFLSRPNERGVSVHYVVEYTGRIVQMVLEGDASGSINPGDLRTTDDAVTFGASVRKAVMGAWDYDPNSAVISVECEGFAKDGLNDRQKTALRVLIEDVRSRFPKMGLLGHRDFQDYKPCPGKLIPWTTFGGHGQPAIPTPEVPVLTFDIDPLATTGTVTVTTTGHSYVNLETGALSPHIVPPWDKAPAFGPVKLTVPIPGGTGDRATGYLIGTRAAFLLAADCTFTPAAVDCAPLQAKIDKALEDLK